MRVIAGSAGGVRLAVPKRGVRPTMDRVKAAIFSSLGDAIVGARVLDLFAGTGALGIEALSRGASSAVFVDITLCDELFLFLAIPTAFPGFGLRNHARELLQQLAAARPSASQPNNFFLTCGFDPDSLGLLFLAPVP